MEDVSNPVFKANVQVFLNWWDGNDGFNVSAK